LLVHLLLVFLLLPELRRVWSRADAATLAFLPQAPPSESKPLEFEFVDLADEREEAPVSDDVPLSDLDRRAHGGEGEAANRPSSAGNTPQLVQTERGDTFERPQRPMVRPPTQFPPPERYEPRPEEQPVQPPDSEPADEGAGETTAPAERSPALPLPAPGAVTMPLDLGAMPENPDRGGGRVDEGGLSFDTQWYDWGPYAKAMLVKIRRNWYARMPELALLGVPGVVRIRFYIERDGTVTGLTITDESGKPPMDFAARDAIAASSAFEPLPADLIGVEREGVTITFYYNLRPPNRG
jgi:TonB family protein